MKQLALIGFKSAGKSSIGRQLAARLSLPFVDLDTEIEKYFFALHDKNFSCRQIMLHHGETYFRGLENKMLEKIKMTARHVIAVGGGMPIFHANQMWLKQQYVIYITANPATVFARIMQSGTPAFFSLSHDPQVEFDQHWRAREIIYQQFADVIIHNDQSITDAVNQIMQHLSK